MGKSQENIRDIIMQAVEAGRISAERTAKDASRLLSAVSTACPP